MRATNFFRSLLATSMGKRDRRTLGLVRADSSAADADDAGRPAAVGRKRQLRRFVSNHWMLNAALFPDLPRHAGKLPASFLGGRRYRCHHSAFATRLDPDCGCKPSASGRGRLALVHCRRRLVAVLQRVPHSCRHGWVRRCCVPGIQPRLYTAAADRGAALRRNVPAVDTRALELTGTRFTPGRVGNRDAADHLDRQYAVGGGGHWTPCKITDTARMPIANSRPRISHVPWRSRSPPCGRSSKRGAYRSAVFPTSDERFRAGVLAARRMDKDWQRHDQRSRVEAVAGQKQPSMNVRFRMGSVATSALSMNGRLVWLWTRAAEPHGRPSVGAWMFYQRELSGLKSR